MSIISPLPRPKTPPISFFQPITLENEMSDVEFLLGVLKKLNEVVLQTNSNTQFIEDYSGKIEEIETEIANLREEMTQFEQDVNNNIALQFAQIKVELQAAVATILNQANAYTDAIAAQLRSEIEQISVGDITVYDPTTGLLSPLQTALDNIYGAGRDDALTATEYDALELTATAYDAYQVSAFDYDKYGKTILV